MSEGELVRCRLAPGRRRDATSAPATWSSGAEVRAIQLVSAPPRPLTRAQAAVVCGAGGGCARLARLAACRNAVWTPRRCLCASAVSHARSGRTGIIINSIRPVTLTGSDLEVDEIGRPFGWTADRMPYSRDQRKPCVRNRRCAGQVHETSVHRRRRRRDGHQVHSGDVRSRADSDMKES